MLDLAGIMFSTIMMLIVVLTAVKLDRALPWFEAPARRGAKPSPKSRHPGEPVGEIPSWRSRAVSQPVRRH
jgi:hypothetical protein